MYFFKRSVIAAIQLFASTLFIVDCSAQKKFEIGLRVDPLNAPLNKGIYVESGLGYHDIHARGHNGVAGYLDFSYWPHRNLGFSIGMGIRKFSSEISYEIPDPFNANKGIVFANDYRYSTLASGPVINMLFRVERFRAKIGMGLYNFHNPDFVTRSSISSITYSNPDVGTLAQLVLTESSYWLFSPTHYNLLQFAAEYNVISNLYIKVGFETTLKDRDVYPYTLTITGFTENTTRQEHLLNDFKKRNTHAALSVGVAYVIGFGGYEK